MNILIIGGTRYMGISLIKYLDKSNSFDNVYTLSKHPNPKFNDKHFVGNRKNVASLKKILLLIKPDIIIDMINFDEEDSKNIVAFYEEGLLKNLKNYIVLSTFFVYQFFDINVFKEKNLLSLAQGKEITDEYTKRKIYMENALYESELFPKTTIIRFPFVFSFDDYTNRFQKLCKISINSKINTFKNKNKFSMISKKCAVQSLTLLSKIDPLGFIDIANKNCYEINQIVEHISKFKNNNVTSKLISLKSNPYPVNCNLCLSNNKISLNKPLLEAIEEEAKQYFKNKN